MKTKKYTIYKWCQKRGLASFANLSLCPSHLLLGSENHLVKRAGEGVLKISIYFSAEGNANPQQPQARAATLIVEPEQRMRARRRERHARQTPQLLTGDGQTRSVRLPISPIKCKHWTSLLQSSLLSSLCSWTR
mmetsp:Transcript_19705/g.41536  ORF Transcript_19705/g.41536 Transcript_19705/m.41536 type:complete len:134 (+) Transcript_19705:213-614(+)